MRETSKTEAGQFVGPIAEDSIMKAAVLEDVAKMATRSVPDPEVGPRHALIRVGAVGVCGTDLHLFQGHGNYNFDSQGRPIPLTMQPQILGHEFSGEILEVGREVKDLKPGDRVLCDQGLNCVSQGRSELCAYCASGDSHQCQYYREHGITGLPGALAEYIAIPAVNCIQLPDDMSTEQGALVEPLACVTHCSERVERAPGRYTFDGSGGTERIRNIMICGAGPAGLLFLQYLRNVKRFDGRIVVSDVRGKNLKLVEDLGGAPVNATRTDLVAAARELTSGEPIDYLIEACGNPAVYMQVPSLVRKQATILIYGAGHKGQDISVLDPVFFIEPTLVAAIGASGGFDKDGRPLTYRRALEWVHSKKVQPLQFITHRYAALEDIHNAFERDFQRPDYIKGVLTLD
jgi:L-iditol 2-dehydrogenase